MLAPRWILPRPLLLVLVTAACSSNRSPAAGAPRASDPCSGAQAQLWDDANFGGRRLTVEYPGEHASLERASADGGAQGLNDRISSAKWNIPVGCKLVLYEDVDFRGNRFALVGSGRLEQNANLGAFGDRASSLRWERS